MAFNFLAFAGGGAKKILEDAETERQEVKELFDTSARLWTEMGITNLQTNRAKRKEYEKIAELNPNFKTNLAVADLSGCFCDEHECNTAIEYYTKAINSINQTIKKENDIWELMEMKNEKLLLFSKRAKEYRHIKDFEKAEKDSASFEKLNQEINDFKTEKEKL